MGAYVIVIAFIMTLFMNKLTSIIIPTYFTSFNFCYIQHPNISMMNILS